jgi:transglutaminase-like putative cysteine protease
MTSRKRPGPKHPKPKASIDPGLVIPPLVPATAEARRTTAREAASRLAKMTPEEQAAALFQSMGAHKKR